MNFDNKAFKLVKKLPLILVSFGMLAVIIELGFRLNTYIIHYLEIFYLIAILTGFISIAARYLNISKIVILKTLLPDIIILVIAGITILGYFETIPYLRHFIQYNKIWLKVALTLIYIRETSVIQLNFKLAFINPAQIFILSFISLILIGCILLLLPNSTYSGISFIDALFTSTSAVCVTGLTVVDTGIYFTRFGQIIIISLIQAGGIGIMTFASYFGYFFKGTSSFKKQLLMNELTWPGKLGEVFSTLKRIIIITFFIESLGALLIFFNIDQEAGIQNSEKLFFSVFHSISGFCNAGFSTLGDSLYSLSFRYNYSLHIIIASLFILGGIGFPIVFNILKYLKTKLLNSILRFFGKKISKLPWILNINTRIVILSTIFLIIFGTLLYFIFEYNNTLAEHNLWGKIIISFFGAVTPRTAGFNTTDTAMLSLPVLLLTLFLMWVGASPASTGGGIKTSTLAIALLNILAITRGKKRLEIFGREIPQTSVNRAFSVMFLSILAISLSVFCVLQFEKDKNFLDVCFECISAFSTVGLSRGITSSLDNYSKCILILTMFTGRVGTLTILIALSKKVIRYKYRYPSEDILIN